MVLWYDSDVNVPQYLLFFVQVESKSLFSSHCAYIAIHRMPIESVLASPSHEALGPALGQS